RQIAELLDGEVAAVAGGGAQLVDREQDAGVERRRRLDGGRGGGGLLGPGGELEAGLDDLVAERALERPRAADEADVLDVRERAGPALELDDVVVLRKIGARRGATDGVVEDSIGAIGDVAALVDDDRDADDARARRGRGV